MAIKNDDQENLFYAYVIFPSAYQHDAVPPYRHYAPMYQFECVRLASTF